MANDITKNPLIVDSTGTLYATGTMVSIQSIKFVGATASHKLTLTDGADRVVWDGTSVGTSTDNESRVSFTSNGLKVSAIGSGKGYIYTFNVGTAV